MRAGPRHRLAVAKQGSGTAAREYFFNIAQRERIEVGKGDFWCTPGGVEHGFEAGPDGAQVIDMFAPLRTEYRLAGEGFGD